MHVTFRVNLAQPHQCEQAEWFQAGFERLGINLEVTPSRNAPGDVHIVSGPHYAKDAWLGHPRTILLDRAYYHEEKSGQWASMDFVSLGWLRSDGGRTFKVGQGRPAPTIAERPTGGTLFLADYLGPIEDADTVRLHPSQQPSGETLQSVLRRHSHAIGYQTTALVAAALEGLEITCKDKRNIMSEPNWLELLPYADWHFTEIQSGEAIAHLWSSLK